MSANLYNPMNIFSTMILVVGVLVVLGTDSKVGAWLGMEINVFGFLGVLSVRNSVSISVGLKYFIVQAVGSGLFLVGVLCCYSSGLVYNQLVVSIGSLVLGFGLFCKAGVFPFHGWVPSVISSGDWLSGWFVMGVQKLAPLIMLFVWVSDQLLLLGLMGLSVVGSLGGLNQHSVRGILAYSSLVHGSWMLASLCCSESLFILYFFGYFLQLSVLVTICYKLDNNSMKSNVLCPLGGIMALSLAGLPPMGGFLLKLAVFLSIGNISLLVFPIAGSVVSLVFYLRLMSGFVLGYSWVNSKVLSNLFRVFILFNGICYAGVGMVFGLL
uniref:NADH dehydrogenase subunit 2 n=1 Tax=Modiolus modulaides TaxID=2784319 RepID=UPI0022383D5F|nr:NADH dehydrogenase subunit 2 [Modiolus modulaides]UYA96807.1 NADH dehydrogenase subunit 2 [Modiolus modulaides]